MSSSMDRVQSDAKSCKALGGRHLHRGLDPSPCCRQTQLVAPSLGLGGRTEGPFILLLKLPETNKA